MACDTPVFDHHLVITLLSQIRIVRHNNQRCAVLALLAKEQLLDLGTRLAIQVAGWLIGKQDLRLAHDCPGNRQTLLLPTRQILGLIVLFAGQANRLERLVHLGAALRPRHTSDLQR